MSYMLTSNKYLSDAELAHLDMVLAKEDTPATLMLRLLADYGMRTSELLILRPCDLNDEAQSIFITPTKSSNPRELPIKPDIYVRLRREADKCVTDEMRIFEMSRVTLFRIWHWWRPCEKPLHSLRHTCAVNLYKRTRDIKLVQKVLGHKSISNTMIYTDFVYSHDELRKALVG